jgi:putative ABC transport system permease protein
VQLLDEVLEALWRRPLRTALTALAVLWGIYMLVVLLGLGRGLEHAMMQDFRSQAINSIWVSTGKTSVPTRGRPPGRSINLDDSDREALRAHIPQIDSLSGHFYLYGDFSVSYRDRRSSFDIRGVDPDFRQLRRLELLRGRFIDDIDVREHRKVAVIGRAVASQLFDEADPVGQTIEIRGLRFTVVGVFDNPAGEQEVRRVYVPLATTQLIYQQPHRIHTIVFSFDAHDEGESQAVAALTRSVLAERKGFVEDDQRALSLENNFERYLQAEQVFRWMSAFTWVVGLGALATAGVGVANIVAINARERTQEFAIRRALGAPARSIHALVLVEAVFVTMWAGMLGILLAALTLDRARVWFKDSPLIRDPEVDVVAAVVSLVALALTAVLAGVFPARKAARGHLVEGLRGR